MDKVISSCLVDMLIHTYKGHALLKDSKTGEYLTANTAHLAVYGFNHVQDIIGHDIWSLNNNVMSPMWQDNAAQVSMFDAEVIHTGKPVIHPKRVWLNAQGFVWVHHMSKIPIIGVNNAITAILSLGEDLTHSLRLEELYHYYNYFYKNKRTAMMKFLEHAGIHNEFYELPSNAEAKILITKARLHHNKLVALHLDLQLSTIQSCINQLGKKAKSLDIVLKILRSW